MSSGPENDDVRALLARLGLGVPAEDIPFLQRTRDGQQAFLRGEIRQVPAQTEPAVVFSPPA